MQLQATLTTQTSQTTTRVLLTRQPAFPLWMDQPVANFVQALSYPISPGVTLAPGETYSFLGTSPTSVGAGQTATAIRTAGSVPPWVYPLTGYDDETGPSGSLFIYVPANCGILVGVQLLSALSGPVTSTIVTEYWNGPGNTVQVKSTPAVSGTTGQFDLLHDVGANPSGSWVRLVSIYTDLALPYMFGAFVAITPTGFAYTRATASTAGLLTPSSSPVYMMVPPAAPPNFAQTNIPYVSTRTTASSLLMTNVTKVLNKEGVINASRLVPEDDSYWDFSLADVISTHPLEKRQLSLEHGLYTFTLPNADALSFKSYSDDATPQIPSKPLVNLGDRSMVHAIVLTDADTATPTTMAVSIDWHIEFRTVVTLFDLRATNLTLEAFHQAQLACFNVGFFWNNDTHKGALSRLWPALLAGVKAYGGAPARFARAALAGYSAFNNANSTNPAPVTTSLPPSGFLPTKRSKSIKSQLQSVGRTLRQLDIATLKAPRNPTRTTKKKRRPVRQKR